MSKFRGLDFVSAIEKGICCVCVQVHAHFVGNESKEGRSIGGLYSNEVVLIDCSFPQASTTYLHLY